MSAPAASGAQAMLAKAASQLGYVQQGNTIFGDWYGARHNDPADDAADWCAMFMGWCGWKSGQGDVVGEFAWVPFYVDWFKGRGQFGQAPRVGAICFMDFVLGLSGQGSHVGVVEKVNADGTVGTIEGNTGSPGQVARRTRSAEIIGYGYPAYHSLPVPAVVDDDAPEGLLAAGHGAITPVALPRGRYRTVGLLCDNGLQGLPAAEVRVAVHSALRGWSQIVPKLVVDSAKGQSVVTFEAADVDGLSFQRADDGAARVSYEMA